ncbi:MAG: response regulator [Deltaproteobacteria bacterium]|jgi:signal transduction histidine kinase/CheY-like chemotaxis protein|nr:response regulator [Deltaproteobacteria bacterium]
MNFLKIIGSNIKSILLIWSAFLIMVVVSHFYVNSGVKEQIDLHSSHEINFYKLALDKLFDAHEAALTNAAAVMALALDRQASQFDLEEIVRVLGGVYANQSDIQDVFARLYGVIDGRIIETSDLTAESTLDLQSAERLKAVLAANGLFRSEPFVDPQTQQTVASASLAVRDGQGVVRGFMAVDFLLEPIIARTSSYQLGGQGHGLLLSSSMVLLAYPQADQVGRKLSDIPELAPLVNFLRELGPEAQVSNFNYLGVKQIGFFSRLSNGWSMGIFCPIDYYLHQSFSIKAALVLVGLVLAIVLSLLIVRLNMAKIQSEEKNRSKSSFLARVSHEIRTPMNAIVGLSELAHRDFGRPQVLGYIIEIRRAASILLGIINDILDFSKIESGKFSIIETHYDLDRLLGDVLAIIRLRADEKSLKIETSIDPTLPKGLLGDDRGLRQVLLNLISNAIKYTPSGFVKLSASGQMVNDQVIKLNFTIEDSGVGISSEGLDKLFTDFVRLADRRIGRNVEGTGLGLVISRHICRQMNGDVTAESQPGQGSKFTAFVQQVVIDPSPIGASEGAFQQVVPAPRNVAAFTASGYRVLVVDDIATNLMVARELLAPYGMEVVTCLSGKQAVRAEAEQPFDLFFIDHMMPDIDGVETLRRIRSLGGRSLSTPAVALTANAVAGAREMLISQGFDDFLSKPIDSDEMTDILDKWVQPGARQESVFEETQPTYEDATDMDKLFVALKAAHVDTNLGLKRCGGIPAVYVRILETFVRDLERISEQLKTETQLQDAASAEALTITVHAVKSATANIGAEDISAEALRLETALKSGDLSDVTGGGLASFCQSLLSLSTSIKEALAAFEGRVKTSGASGGSVGPEELGRLKVALAENDGSLAERLLSELGKKADPGLRRILSQISYHVILSDYREALKLIEGL